MITLMDEQILCCIISCYSKLTAYRLDQACQLSLLLITYNVLIFPICLHMERKTFSYFFKLIVIIISDAEILMEFLVAILL